MADPDGLAREIAASGQLDMVVGPSGYGLPVSPAATVSNDDLRLAFLSRPGETGGIGGIGRLARSLGQTGLPMMFIPGIVHLDTVPRHRKLNRVDLGTADKVSATALAIVEQSKRRGRRLVDVSLILVELGGAFTAGIAVHRGQIVDGVGGTAGPIGWRSSGAWDGEVAFLAGEVTKAALFQGGVETVVGSDPRERETAIEAYVEGVARMVAQLLCSAPDADEVLLSGRRAADPEVLHRISERIAGPRQVRPLAGFASVAKEGAQGAALIADGLAGGTPPRSGGTIATAACGGNRSRLPARHHTGYSTQPPGAPVAVSETHRSLIVAGVTTRALAVSAARAGWKVTAVDAFGDRDLRAVATVLTVPKSSASRFTPVAAARIARAVSAGTAAYTSNFENHPDAVAILSENRRLLGNRPQVLEEIRNPFTLMRALSRRGFAVPCTRASAPRVGTPGRWLRKPRRSGGGHGTIPWRRGSLPRSSYLQARIVGIPGSIAFLADGRHAVPIGISRQLVGEKEFGSHGFRYCGSLLAGGRRLFDRGDEVASVAVALAAAVTEEFGLIGLNGLDFVARGGIPYPIEVNPRYSASMELVERSTRSSLFQMHERSCAGVLPDPIAAPRNVSGKGVVFARRTVTITDSRRWGSSRLPTCLIPANESPAGVRSAQCSPKDETPTNATSGSCARLAECIAWWSHAREVRRELIALHRIRDVPGLWVWLRRPHRASEERPDRGRLAGVPGGASLVRGRLGARCDHAQRHSCFPG